MSKELIGYIVGVNVGLLTGWWIARSYGWKGRLVYLAMMNVMMISLSLL